MLTDQKTSCQIHYELLKNHLHYPCSTAETGCTSECGFRFTFCHPVFEAEKRKIICDRSSELLIQSLPSFRKQHFFAFGHRQVHASWKREAEVLSHFLSLLWWSSTGCIQVNSCLTAQNWQKNSSSTTLPFPSLVNFISIDFRLSQDVNPFGFPSAQREFNYGQRKIEGNGAEDAVPEVIKSWIFCGNSSRLIADYGLRSSACDLLASGQATRNVS